MRLASNVTGTLVVVVGGGGDDDVVVATPSSSSSSSTTTTMTTPTPTTTTTTKSASYCCCCCSSAKYWRQHLRGTVMFEKAVKSIAVAGCRAFVEVGPHPVLIGMTVACLRDFHLSSSSSSTADHQTTTTTTMTMTTTTAPLQLLLLPSLRRGTPAWGTLLESVGRVFTDGAVEIEFARLFTASSATATATFTAKAAAMLPTYPFQRKRHWVSEGSDGRVLWPAAAAAVSSSVGSGSCVAVSEDQRSVLTAVRC